MKQFAEVSSSRGALMGRREFGTPEDAKGKIEVFRVRLFDGAYDDGGAYWGGPPSQPLYCARDEGGGFQQFTRAGNIAEACATFDLDPSLVVIPDFGLDDDYAVVFIDAYIACALWTSTDDDGNPRDGELVPGDIDPATRAQMHEDCVDFLNSVWPIDPEFWTAEQAGYDFWLTRNGHGAGFWDRYSFGPGNLEGERLSEAARLCGGYDLYIADGGVICGSYS